MATSRGETTIPCSVGSPCDECVPVCSLCGVAAATTTYGLAVCQPCRSWLITLRVHDEQAVEALINNYLKPAVLDFYDDAKNGRLHR